VSLSPHSGDRRGGAAPSNAEQPARRARARQLHSLRFSFQVYLSSSLVQSLMVPYLAVLLVPRHVDNNVKADRALVPSRLIQGSKTMCNL
jgi:hypothetical protein